MKRVWIEVEDVLRFAVVASASGHTHELGRVPEGRIGPEVNRDTVSNVQAAGFDIRKVTNIFLDVVKTIEATAPVT